MSVELNNELVISSKSGVFSVTLDRRRKATHRYATLLAVGAIPQVGDVEVAALCNLSDVFPVEKMQESEEVRKEVIRCLTSSLLAPLFQSIAGDLKLSVDELMVALPAALSKAEDLPSHKYLVTDENPDGAQKEPEASEKA